MVSFPWFIVNMQIYTYVRLDHWKDDDILGEKRNQWNNTAICWVTQPISTSLQYEEYVGLLWESSYFTDQLRVVWGTWVIAEISDQWLVFRNSQCNPPRYYILHIYIYIIHDLCIFTSSCILHVIYMHMQSTSRSFVSGWKKCTTYMPRAGCFFSSTIIIQVQWGAKVLNSAAIFPYDSRLEKPPIPPKKWTYICTAK